VGVNGDLKATTLRIKRLNQPILSRDSSTPKNYDAEKKGEGVRGGVGDFKKVDGTKPGSEKVRERGPRSTLLGRGISSWMGP